MAQIIQTPQGNYLLGVSEQGQLRNERDILDVIGHIWEVGANLLLIPEGALHPDFFDLSTGLAGDITLKLSAYRIKTAIIANIGSIPSQPFREWAGECNRGGDIRFFEDLDGAEGWLLEP